jgi:hypothetical protein
MEGLAEAPATRASTSPQPSLGRNGGFRIAVALGRDQPAPDGSRSRLSERSQPPLRSPGCLCVLIARLAHPGHLAMPR